jgi:hypothetical protein
MRTYTASIRTDIGTVVLLLLLLLAVGASRVSAQTEPEAPKAPEVLYNGWQISFYGGASMFYTNGNYSGRCDCDFVGDISSLNLMYGGSLNLPVHEDFSLYLRAGRNNASTIWSTARSDSLPSGGVGYMLSELTFDYDIVHIDFLFRLIGSMDGERVYFGPSFGLVRKKHIRIVDTELSTGITRIADEGPLDVEHDMRVSLVIGAEYAFIPVKNLYVVPALEVDYSFSRILQERSGRPNFSLRPTYYKFLLTVAYQLF